MTPFVKSPEIEIRRLLENQKVRRAADFFAQNAERITAEQIEITKIPAPPFGEAKRAEFFKQKFIDAGLTDARIDEEGNCLALRRGRKDAPLIVASAHLDTVFPAETDLSVRRDGKRIFAPGIMDDGCGLIALIALAEALKLAEIETAGSILFVATVGEEGAGNLRGVRHLFTKSEFASQIDGFISFDGAGVEQIVNRALGSRRYRVEIKSPGGHSWLDFGSPNPVHALGRAIAKLANFPLPKKPKTTFNVGRIEGGTSVNAIPVATSIEVDLRSESKTELNRLDAFFRRAISEAATEENDARNQKYSKLEINIEQTGERPSGATDESSRLVQLAMEATKVAGFRPSLAISSTDSNVPMSLNVPAITLGAGGTGDRMHTTGEWYDPTGREAGLIRALLLILSLTGI